VAKREGPKITIEKSCLDCKWCDAVFEACQGDSGHTVYCKEPRLEERKAIGWSNWDTPDWCPCLQHDKESPFRKGIHTSPVGGGRITS
jgi:hypothetical protein